MQRQPPRRTLRDYAQQGRTGQGGRHIFAPVMLMPCLLAECARLTSSCRAGGRHAIIGLDAMRSTLKTLLACILLALAPAGQPLRASTAAQDAQTAPNPPKPPPTSQSTLEPRTNPPPQTQSLAQSGAKRAPSAAKSGAPQSQAAQQPTAVPASTPQPPVVTQPMAE